MFGITVAGGYVRIKVTHRDFSKVTECSFWKIIVDHRDSGISTVIPNIHLFILLHFLFCDSVSIRIVQKLYKYLTGKEQKQIHTNAI
jgi:hypothetical protein